VSSSFKSLNLFGSGPHRFAESASAEVLDSELFSSVPNSGSRYIGLGELAVLVTGRLAASGESALWTLWDAITAQVVDPPEPGMLVDTHGRSWGTMSLVRATPGDRVDRGRAWTMSYQARFLRFREYPQ
jgi:hypothetical protein